MGGRDKLAEGMLKFTAKPIHTSMTDLGKMSKVAKLLHKCILGYMGDRQYTNPLPLAVELLDKGVTSEVLATETFCLIIKQMTENPVENSRQRGVELLALCVAILPIATDFEYFLMTYINAHAPRPKNFISVIHERKYGDDPKKAVPSVEEINKICDSVLNRQDEQRSRFSMKPSSPATTQLRTAARAAVANAKRTKPKSVESHSTGGTAGEVKPPAAPATPPPSAPAASSSSSNMPLAVAWWDFEAQDKSMMSFKEGDKLRIVEQPDDGWWKAQ